jgi:hydrogenase expression/formation protein HypC
LNEEVPMCLGIPGKVVETYREHDILMGKVQFGGISRRVCLEHVPDVRVEEYVLVHVGFALSRIDEVEARRVFEFLDSMEQLGELGPEEVEGFGPEATEIRAGPGRGRPPDPALSAVPPASG